MELYLFLITTELDLLQYLMLYLAQLYPQEPTPLQVMTTTVGEWDPWLSVRVLVARLMFFLIMDKYLEI